MVEVTQMFFSVTILPGNHSVSASPQQASTNWKFLVQWYQVGLYATTVLGLASATSSPKKFVDCTRSGDIQNAFGASFKTYYGLHLQSVQTAEIIVCTFQDSYGSALRAGPPRGGGDGVAYNPTWYHCTKNFQSVDACCGEADTVSLFFAFHCIVCTQ